MFRPFATNDAALHIVVGNINRTGRAVSRVRGCVTLHGRQQDLLRFLIGNFGQAFLMFEDFVPDFLFEFLLEQVSSRWCLFFTEAAQIAA